MITYKNDDLNKIIINESFIEKIEWLNKGKDLSFSIDWCGQEDLADEIDFLNVKTNLIFKFSTEIEFNFKYEDDSMGAMEITEFNFVKNENGKYQIKFDFAYQPIGYIKFNCNDFYFEIIPNA